MLSTRAALTGSPESSASWSAVSSRLSGARSRVCTVDSRRTRTNHSRALAGVAGSSVRQVPTMGTSIPRFSRCSTRSRVVASAQCRSSTTRASGRTDASASRIAPTAVNRRCRAKSPDPSGSRTSTAVEPGTQRLRRSATYGAHLLSAAPSHRPASLRRSPRSASETGSNGTLCGERQAGTQAMASAARRERPGGADQPGLADARLAA